MRILGTEPSSVILSQSKWLASRCGFWLAVDKYRTHFRMTNIFSVVSLVSIERGVFPTKQIIILLLSANCWEEGDGGPTYSEELIGFEI